MNIRVMRGNKRETFLPFAKPSIGEDEIAEVVDSLRSGWITTGPKVKKFETEFAQYLNTDNAIAVNSCTGGLHIALAALGIGPGDEVILPTLTFCSTANVVVLLGAIPVLVDVGNDFNILPESIESSITSQTKAIIVVHYGGQSCDLSEIYEIAAKHDLPVIEDAAHAVGSSYKDRNIGSDDLDELVNGVKRVTVFSFYAIKNMTTGEGGMITTSNGSLANRMRRLSLHGMSRDAWKRYQKAGSWYYEVVAAGFKYNMTDIQAAMGIHQLRKLEGFIQRRQMYAAMYDEVFTNLEAIEPPVRLPDRNHVFHLYEIKLNLDQLGMDRDMFIEEFRKLNIGTSVHFIPVHFHPFYRDKYGYKSGMLPNAERLFDQIVSLPLYPAMSEEDVYTVIDVMDHVINHK